MALCNAPPSVNNAGYGNLAAIEDTTAQDFRAQIETNLFGVVNLTKAAIPVMRTHKPRAQSSGDARFTAEGEAHAHMYSQQGCDDC